MCLLFAIFQKMPPVMRVSYDCHRRCTRKYAEFRNLMVRRCTTIFKRYYERKKNANRTVTLRVTRMHCTNIIFSLIIIYILYIHITPLIHTHIRVNGLLYIVLDKATYRRAREDTEKLKTLYDERDYSARTIPTPYNRFCDIIYFKKLIRFVFFFFYFISVYIFSSLILYDIMFLKRRSPDVYETTGVPSSYTYTYSYTDIHAHSHTSSDTMGLAYSSYVNVCPMINRILIYSWICCCSRMSNERPLVPIRYFFKFKRILIFKKVSYL
jgi:hypothetical protein